MVQGPTRRSVLVDWWCTLAVCGILLVTTISFAGRPTASVLQLGLRVDKVAQHPDGHRDGAAARRGHAGGQGAHGRGNGATRHPRRRKDAAGLLPFRGPPASKTMFVHIHKSGGTSFCKMAQVNPAVHMDKRQYFRNCNWQRQFGEPVAPGYPLRTCDDMHRIFEQQPTIFLAKEDVLDVGLRACDGVKYVALIREPLDRLKSHIQYAKWTDEEVHRFSSGGSVEKSSRENHYRSYTTFNDMSIRVLLGSETYDSPYLSINASHVEEAKRLLETFALVLPTDQLNHPQLDRILGKTLGWAPGTKAWHAKNQQSIRHRGLEELWGQELLSRLRNSTKEDQEVYQWARKRFVDEWGEAEPKTRGSAT